MDDLISRQAAISHVDDVPYIKEHPNVGLLWKAWIESLPAAQPDVPDINFGDMVSRQAAVDALDEIESEVADGYGYQYEKWRKYFCELPSAQPETAKRIVGKSRDGMTLWYQCDMCNEPVDAQDNFCRGCGRRLTDG